MINIKRGKYRNLSLKINSKGELIVCAPNRLDEKLIYAFISKKQTWIERHLKDQEQNKLLSQKYQLDKFGYIFNIPYLFQDEEPKTFYINAFKNKVLSLLDKFSKKIDFQASKITIMNSKRVWGCLDNKNRLKLNIALVVIPQKLCEYVLIHEICHSKEFNHSKKFWNKVEEYCQDYKFLRKDLKKYAFLLGSNELISNVKH